MQTTASWAAAPRLAAEVSPASSNVENAARCCRQITKLCLGLAILISTSTLIGWWADVRVLASFHLDPNVIPMAPSTALTFLVMSAAVTLVVWGENRSSRVARWLVIALALPVAGYGLQKLYLFAHGQIGGKIEKRLAGVDEENAAFDQAEPTSTPLILGVMSPLTALCFLFTALVLFFLALGTAPWFRRLTAFCSVAVVLLSLWVLLRYLESSEQVFRWLNEQEGSVPMAISTGLGFLCLGIALVTVEGPRQVLIRPLIGNSARAVLLRAFLPATLFVVFFPFVVRRLFIPLENDNGVALDIRSGFSAGWMLISGGVTVLVISWVSQRIGLRIDRAEAETERAIKELREARDAAKASDRAKSEFLANMSHELRTPLNSVIGYSEILKEEAQEQGHEQFLPDLTQIHVSGQHLLALINDILDLSKIEAGEMRLKPDEIDLDDFVSAVMISVRPNIEKNRNEFRLIKGGDLGRFTSDPIRLRQCLFNLLSNAGKFTEEGTVTLHALRETRGDGDWVVFRVIDTGIGMSLNQLDLIFQPFKQADTSTTRRYEGTGLGLTICRKLMALLGGTVRVESTLGQGSVFTLELPLGAEPASLPAGTTSEPPVSEGLEKTALGVPGPGQNSVMVVDDDAAVRKLLTRFLEKEGFQVVAVARGEEVVETAKRVKPQAITLDVMMPEMDGWEVIAQLKADPETAGIPVVILSIVDDKNMGYVLGAADYLTKPFDRQRLLTTLSRYCNVSEPGLALVVEDDAPSRELLRRTLEKDGWMVEEASNGQDAWACITHRPPSLILLDLMMPDMDGFEFLDELRQRPQWRSIPVIVITAKDLTDEDRMYLNGSLFLSGSVKQVLQKGHFDRQEFLKEVHELVKSPPG